MIQPLEYSNDKAAFFASLRGLLEIEGGYSDHPDDAGGKTNHGITESVARRHGYEGPMDDLPLNIAAAIYHVDYWLGSGCHHMAMMSQPLADRIFNVAVLMGPQRAVKMVQQALNLLNRQESDWNDIRADGAFGSKTLGALHALSNKRGKQGIAVLTEIIRCRQGSYLVDRAITRPANESFLYGWFLQRIVKT